MKRLLLLVMLAFVAGCNATPGSGEKIGQIIRLHRVGLLNETWEGELIRGGLQGGSGAIGVQPFHFTVSDNNPELVKQVQAALRTQAEVLVTYDLPVMFSLMSSDSGAFLTSITFVKDETP